MATDWYMEGPWFKNCSCDPGCPCDFNQNPTQGYCEGMVAMRVDKGHFGDVDLSGIRWGAIVHWDGALHLGDGHVQPFVSDDSTPEQRDAVFEAMSGKHGDTLMEIFSVICPHVHEPIVAPVEFEFDLESRRGRVAVGDVLVSEVDTLRNINPPTPYRILVKIPDGFEYTNEEETAETALSTRLVSNAAIKYDIANGHSSMAFVRHGNAIRTTQHEATVIGAEA